MSELTSAQATSWAMTYRMSAPNVPESARVARDTVAGLLHATGHPGLVEMGKLLVSELVSNVYLHTEAAQFKIVATVDRDRVLVSVEDSETRVAARETEPAETIDDESVSGRGLLLVRECARSWGVSWQGGPRPAAKQVWFELQDEKPRQRLRLVT